MISPNSTDRILLSLSFALVLLTGFGGMAVGEASAGT